MQNSGANGNGQTGSEDASAAREHVREAEQNRDALAAGPGGDSSSGSGNAQGQEGGMSATGGGASEDASEAAAHADQAARNRDALAEESRRVDQTTPPEVSRD